MDPALINQLAEQGLLGLLLTISISLNFFLIKMLLGEKDKRIEEAGAVTKGIVEPLDEIRNSVISLVNAAVQNTNSRGKR